MQALPRVAVLLVACGSPTPSAPGMFGDSGGLEPDPSDAGSLPVDGGGGSDASLGTDAAAFEDGGHAGDAGASGADGGVLAGTCVSSPRDDRFSFAAQETAATRLALGSDSQGSFIVWEEGIGGTPQIVHTWLRWDREPDMGRALTEGTARHEAPALVRVEDGRFILAWHDNATPPGFAIRLVPLGRAIEGGSPTRLSDPSLGLFNVRFVVLQDESILAVWVAADRSGGRTLQSQLLTGDGARVGGPQTLLPSSADVAEVALTPFGRGALMAYATTGAEAAVYVLRVSAVGAPLEQPVQVSQEQAVSGVVSVASSGDGAIVVYGLNVAGVRPEVRARLVDDGGAPTGIEERLTRPDETGEGPAVVTFLDGYAVAYRSLSKGGEDRPEITLLRLDRGGAVEGVDAIAEVEQPGSRIELTADGDRLLVGWVEGGAVTVARTQCL